MFSTFPKEINIKELRLIKTANVIPIISRKQINVNSKLHTNKINQIKPINSVFLTSARKKEKEWEEIEAQERKFDYLSKTKSIQEYKNLLEKGEKVEQTEEEFIDYFTNNRLIKTFSFL